MSNRIASLFVLVAALSWATSIQACETDPFYFQLEGESKEDAQARTDAVGASFDIVGHYEREGEAFKKAERVFLAKVISKGVGTDEYGNSTMSTQVQPLIKLKGDLPTARQSLVAVPAGGMCTDVGDGTGAFASIGNLVVVFEGLPKSQYRPRSIDSFTTTEIRTVPLLDLLRKVGKDLEE